MKRFRSLIVPAFFIIAVGGWVAISRATSSQNPIGLSLFFQNGQMAPLTLVGDAPRYLQEIDIVATVTTSDPKINTAEVTAADQADVVR